MASASAGCAAAASDCYGPSGELAAQKFPWRVWAAWRRLTLRWIGWLTCCPAALDATLNLWFPPRHWSRTKSVCALKSIRHESETASCQVTEDRDLRIQARTRDVRRHMVAAAAGIFYPAATYLFVVGAQKRSGNISHGLLVLANSEALFFGKVTATAVIPYRNRSGERLVVWPGGNGRLLAQSSHRSVHARIRAYGSSHHGFALRV